MIDYVIINRRFMSTTIIDLRTLNSAIIESDHIPLLCKIRTIFHPKHMTARANSTLSHLYMNVPNYYAKKDLTVTSLKRKIK